jgi:hypothetical protein
MLDTPNSTEGDAMTQYPAFADYMRNAYGPGWSLGGRAAPGATVLNSARYEAALLVWAEGHPAYRLACTLPPGEARAFVCDAVLQRLGVRNLPAR